MSNLRRLFDINLLGLSNKKHDFDFEIDDLFFTLVEESTVKKGRLNVQMTLEKSMTMLNATFIIKGEIELECDRSSEYFYYPIEREDSLIFKYGDAYEEIDEKIIIIPHQLPVLNVAQYIYEFILLTVPLRKLHPKFANELDDNPESDARLIYQSGEDSSEDEEENTNNDIDPRWLKLKNLNLN